MKTLRLAALFLCAALPSLRLGAGDLKPMEEDNLCQRIEDCFRSIQVLGANKGEGRALDSAVEMLSYLVLAAREYAHGSKRLDAIFTKIQKESPTLAVPRFVMTPAEYKKVVAALATDDASERVYLSVQKKLRYMSEWIADAKTAITARSGFRFDRSVGVIRAQ